jgi:hypothetical protein
LGFAVSKGFSVVAADFPRLGALKTLGWVPGPDAADLVSSTGFGAKDGVPVVEGVTVVALGLNKEVAGPSKAGVEPPKKDDEPLSLLRSVVDF